MRNVLFKLLTIILVIVLCINFVRYFVQPNSFTPVKTMSVLDAATEIGADPSPLFDSLSYLLEEVLEVGSTFSTAFSFGYVKNWDILGTIVNYFGAVANLIKATVSSIAMTIVAGWQAIVFVGNFITSIFNFLNVVVGTSWRVPRIPSAPVGGGGFGGRR